MGKEHFISEEIWNYRFSWPERDTYIEDKKKYLGLQADGKKTAKEKIEDRLFLSIKYVFELCMRTAKGDFGSSIRLEKVFNDNVRVPMETVYNDEIFEDNFGGISEEWRFVTVNMNSLENIAGKLINEKHIEDRCQSLEGSTVQELAHILFLEDVSKDSKGRRLFLEQMKNYPKMNDDLSAGDRQTKYLTADIEKHGRLVELDFLSKIYPDSWAEAWVKYDLSKVSTA